ncbi:MAG: M28 family metallopeptidase [Candidatus Njordarchaeia archaeon]
MESPSFDVGEFGLKFVRNVINKFDGRAPGSAKEREAAEYISKELSKYVDDVSIEEFELHPKAFLGFINIVLVLYIATVILMYYRYNFYAFFVSIIGFIILFEEFFRYKEFIDPLFPKRKSVNVIGRLKPLSEPKYTVIISGHHDSAFEFRLLALNRYFYLFTVILGILGSYLLVVASTIAFIGDLLNYINLPQFAHWFVLAKFYLWWILVIILPFMLPMFFFASNKAVPGAVDNLSSVAVVLSIAKELHEENRRFENIEVLFISFGSEEAGLRGSRRFVSKHLEELKKHETYVLNMEMLSQDIPILILTKEKTTGTTHSMELAELVEKVAEKVGIPIEKVEMPSFGGGTDATSFSRAGIKAITLQGSKFNMETFKYYHTRRDTPDKINPKILVKTHKLIKAFLDYLDGKLVNGA